MYVQNPYHNTNWCLHAAACCKTNCASTQRILANNFAQTHTISLADSPLGMQHLARNTKKQEHGVSALLGRVVTLLSPLHLQHVGPISRDDMLQVPQIDAEIPVNYSYADQARMHAHRNPHDMNAQRLFVHWV